MAATCTRAPLMAATCTRAPVRALALIWRYKERLDMAYAGEGLMGECVSYEEGWRDTRVVTMCPSQALHVRVCHLRSYIMV